MSEKVMKYVGAGFTVVGAGLLYYSGVAENEVVGLVAAIFVVGGVIRQLVKK